MRLLDTETGRFVEKDPEGAIYAILSHTWDRDGEQTYEELKKIQQRYDPESKLPQSRLHAGPGSDDISLSSPQRDRGGSISPAPSSHLPNRTTSVITRPTARKRLTESEVEALLRFIEVHGIADPTPAFASNDHHSALGADRHATSPQSIWDDPDLSPKIRNACVVARKNGYRYIWIDSCCIDKSSSSELSEAINSMFKWYSLAAVCYAYLADVSPGHDHQSEGSGFRNSRWFTRGWTLQELIAPISVEFLSRDWAPVGSKHALDGLVESVTKIARRALLHLDPLDKFTVAQRLSWAADRETTREEDKAYSLLGIFDINMPTLYGEGDRAFRRLQEQIIQRIPDQSLFAWGMGLPAGSLSPQPSSSASNNPVVLDAVQTLQSLFADSPARFSCGGSVHRIQLLASYNRQLQYTFTPYGIHARFRMIALTPDLLSRVLLPHRTVERALLGDSDGWYLLILMCKHAEHPGYLLGRVCHITPSKHLYPGYIRTVTGRWSREPETAMDLFLLSPESIRPLLPLAEVEVFIPHPDRADLPSRLRSQPYVAIKLVVLMETRDALRAHGYATELRGPDPGHPATHWLTLSKDEHTIVIKFQYVLKDDGRRFKIEADARMSRTPESSSRLERDRDYVFWWDSMQWSLRPNAPPSQTVSLGAPEAGGLAVDLGLDFAGTGVYYVRVEILGAPPAYSEAPVEPSLFVRGSSRGAIEPASG